MKKLLLTAFIFGCTQLQAIFAQAPAATPAISASFKTASVTVNQNDIYIRQGKDYLPLVIRAKTSSYESVRYNGPVNMPLFRKVKTADTTTYTPAGEIVFPTPAANETGRFLVLFTSVSKGILTASVLRDDVANFPAQSVRVISVLPSSVAVNVNKETLMMAPGETRLFNSTEQADRLEIHVALQHRGEWKEINNNVYAASKDSRRTIFLINTTAADATPNQFPSIGFFSLTDRPNEPVKLAANETAHPTEVTATR